MGRGTAGAAGLADNPGLKAAIAAYWLRALGYEVHVLPVDDAVRDLPALPDVPVSDPIGRFDAAAALLRVASGRARLLDVRRSDRFRAGHVAGALWAVRPRLSRLMHDTERDLLVLGDSESEAALAARDLLALGHRRVRVVSGGFPALRAVGAQIRSTPHHPTRAEAIDFTWFAHGRHDGDLDASRLYFDWEQGLIEQLDPEERAEFGI